MTDEGINKLFNKKRGILADAIAIAEARLAREEMATDESEGDAEPGKGGEK